MGRVVLLAVVLALVAAGPAAAGEVRVVTVPPASADSPMQAYAELHGAPGEANFVTVTAGRSVVRVHDAGAPLRTDDGCRALSEHEAECRVLYAPYFSVELHGEDGNDVLTNFSGHGGRLYGGPGDDVLTGEAVWQFLSGGDGSDRLTGGDGGDGLHGGAGADELRGGEGDDRLTGDAPGTEAWPDILDGGAGDHDVVSYEGRQAGVEIDLAITLPQGEGDVLSGFENAYGGNGSDVIRGTDGRNALYGRTPFPSLEPGVFDPTPTGDVLDGRGGDDRLWGTFGDDRLSGGPGNDRLDGDVGFDRYSGGAGNDVLDLSLAPVGYPRGEARARLTCGPGLDVARDPDASALVPRDCEWVSFEWLDLRLLHVGPRRLVFRIHDSHRHKIGFCRVTARLTRPAARHPFVRRTFRFDRERRRYTATLRWRRAAPPVTIVHVRANLDCAPRWGYRIGQFRVRTA